MPRSVKISECYGDCKTTTANFDTECTDEAVQQALAKRYGAEALFRAIYSLDRGTNRLGQAFKWIGDGAPATLSGRIMITVE